MTSDLNYLIGIDGGGTQCRARISDLEGNVLGEGIAGSANVFQNDELAWHSVSTSVYDAINSAGLSPNITKSSYIVAGLAGAEVSSAVDTFLSHVVNIGHIEVYTDAQIACLGAHTLNDGAIYIVGTGTVGIARKKNQWTKMGGWGFPLNDEGGGAWLGMEAIKTAIKQHDALTSPSLLTDQVWQKFPNGIDELVVWSQHASSGDYGQFAPLVTDAFKKNDIHALAIIERQSLILIEQISVLTNEKLPLCLMGGLSQWVHQLLPQSLKQHLKSPDGDALTGALLLANKRITT